MSGGGYVLSMIRRMGGCDISLKAEGTDKAL